MRFRIKKQFQGLGIIPEIMENPSRLTYYAERGVIELIGKPRTKESPKEKFERGIREFREKNRERLEKGEVTLAELKKNLKRMPWYKSRRAKDLNVGKSARNWGRCYTVGEFKYIRIKYEEIGIATPEEWADIANELDRTLYGIETQVRFVVDDFIFEKAVQRRERLSQ